MKGRRQIANRVGRLASGRRLDKWRACFRRPVDRHITCMSVACHGHSPTAIAPCNSLLPRKQGHQFTSFLQQKASAQAGTHLAAVTLVHRHGGDRPRALNLHPCAVDQLAGGHHCGAGGQQSWSATAKQEPATQSWAYRQSSHVQMQAATTQAKRAGRRGMRKQLMKACTA